VDTMEEKVGYLLRSVEENKYDVRSLSTKMDALTSLVEKKFTVAETILKVFKFGGIVVVAIVTLKFGDIATWWAYLFK